MEKKLNFQLSSAFLHILASLFMLCDHMWGSVIKGNDWLTCIGRLAFTIFAFLLVEGYFHTSNFKKYLLRLFIFAIISEIPFNMTVAESVFFPLCQNTLWTLIIALLLIHLNEHFKDSLPWIKYLVAVTSVALAVTIGSLTKVDHDYGGILIALVFYFFRERNWQNFIIQFIALCIINFVIFGGFKYEFELFGRTMYFTRQGFAVLSLLPIWLYKGKLGYNKKWFKYACYIFYPLHLLIIGLSCIL